MKNKIYTALLLFLLVPGFSYAAITPSLVSYFKCNEVSGPRADSIGPNDLTDNNTVLSGTGSLGTACDFESSNSEYLSITDGSQTGLDLSSAFTLVGRYKPEAGGFGACDGNALTFINKRATLNNAYSFFFECDSTQKIKIQTWSDGITGSTGSVDYTLSTGTEYCIAVKKSGTDFDFYVNGTIVSAGKTGSVDSTVYNGTAPFIIGSNQGTGGYIDGLFYDVGVFNTALSDVDIASICSDGIQTVLDDEASGGDGGGDYVATTTAALTTEDTLFIYMIFLFFISFIGWNYLFRPITSSV